MNEDRIKFHIEVNDYFGTVATVLDLVAQDLRKHGRMRHAETLLRQRARALESSPTRFYALQGLRAKVTISDNSDQTLSKGKTVEFQFVLRSKKSDTVQPLTFKLVNVAALGNDFVVSI